MQLLQNFTQTIIDYFRICCGRVLRLDKAAISIPLFYLQRYDYDLPTPPLTSSLGIPPTLVLEFQSVQTFESSK